MGKLTYFPTALWHAGTTRQPEPPVPDFAARLALWRARDGLRRELFRGDMHAICQWHAMGAYLARCEPQEGA